LRKSNFLLQATPEAEYGRFNIGSRPSKRKLSGGIESLRAIPWIFAWTQTRFHLPVWLGMGTAFKYAIEKDAENFNMSGRCTACGLSSKVTIDLVEMVLANRTLEFLLCMTDFWWRRIYILLGNS